MTLREKITAIRNGRVEPIYFLNGDDYFLQSLFIEEVIKTLSAEKDTEKNFFSGEPKDCSNLLSHLFSGSLFSSKKLYVLHNPIRISGRTKDDLFSYFAKPNLDNCLIIILDKVDKRLSFYKNLSQLVKPLNTSPPFQNRMADWINFLVNRCDLTISIDAKELLLEICGDSVSHAANEIEKIKIGLPENSKVKLNDIKKFCGWERDYFPWQLCDALGRRDIKGGIKIGRSLLSRGLDTSIVVSQIGTFFQELYFTYLPKIKEESLPKTGWISQNLTRKLPSYLNNFSQDEIGKILRLIYSSDIKIKTGKSSGELLLIPLIHKIADGHVQQS